MEPSGKLYTFERLRAEKAHDILELLGKQLWFKRISISGPHSESHSSKPCHLFENN